ncbi:lipoprotein [Pseudooceanicola sp. MF1-13]|uniref:lipoprotein n=1 Tax=Pseudooceanicola sp. MF1-13 TaxID=3379095 RepID=UPI003892BFED
MKRLFLALVAVAALAGCIRNPEFQPPAEMAALAVPNRGPNELVLYTVVNRRTGAGAHTALGVNASERVLFDPAGGFKAENVIRSGDVLYGFTPPVEKAFSSAHARSTFLVNKVSIPVSAEVAQMALQKVKTNGPVGSAHCAQSTSSILQTLPGFQSIKPTYYPVQLEKQFKAVAGARSTQIVEND